MPRLFYVLPKTRFLRYNTMRNHRAAFVMTTAGILTVPKREIHTTVFASVDDDNLPQARIIGLMPAGENGLYVFTAKGKSFCRRRMVSHMSPSATRMVRIRSAASPLSCAGGCAAPAGNALTKSSGKNRTWRRSVPCRRAARRSLPFSFTSARANSSIYPGCRRFARVSARAAGKRRSASTALQRRNVLAAQAV